jgi:5-methylcytosine-specific restriction endonuclease McrA
MRASKPTVAAPTLLSDDDLLAAAERVAGDERRTTAELLALLAELDTRKLYLGQGYSSLFTYCTQRLRLSESAAYGRITAARAARRFPILLFRLAEGDVTLTSINLLAAHLTDDNHESLLDAAKHASRRDVERLVASLHAQPDIPASVRRVPNAGERLGVGTFVLADPKGPLIVPPASSVAPASVSLAPAAVTPPATPTRPQPRPAVAPLASDRYLMRVTIDASTHAKFERARDLSRHSIPNGDVALIIDRALTLLVEQLEKRKAGHLSRQESAVNARSARRAVSAKGSRGRHVPAAVRRLVWTRDQGRCAFVGAHGLCGETGFLEYHHVVPFTAGGATNVANLELRCRAHNAYEATVWFGSENVGPAPRRDADARTLFEQSDCETTLVRSASSAEPRPEAAASEK